MENLLRKLKFYKEEIEEIVSEYSDISSYKIEQIIELLKSYNCSNEFIREILIHNKKLFYLEFARVQYIFDAIVANGDIIEETLLEII